MIPFPISFKEDFEMKRVWALVLALASLSCAESAFAQTKQDLSRYAPADEYFGQLQISILGIRNLIHDLGMAYDKAPDRADAIMGKASIVEASLRDWEQKYPRDPALGRYVYDLCRLYQKIDLDDARRKGVLTQSWLFSRYADTHYAADELKRLASGSVRQSNTVSSVK
jgi:hypothetical protein